MQILRVFGIEKTPEAISTILARGSTCLLQFLVWRHGQVGGVKKSYYVVTDEVALEWIFEQAIHLRHACCSGGVSRIFALSWTIEREG